MPLNFIIHVRKPNCNEYWKREGPKGTNMYGTKNLFYQKEADFGDFISEINKINCILHYVQPFLIRCL